MLTAPTTPVMPAALIAAATSAVTPAPPTVTVWPFRVNVAPETPEMSALPNTVMVGARGVKNVPAT